MYLQCFPSKREVLDSIPSTEEVGDRKGGGGRKRPREDRGRGWGNVAQIQSRRSRMGSGWSLGGSKACPHFAFRLVASRAESK